MEFRLVLPVVIEDIIRRFLSKFSLLVTGNMETDACSNINLYSRLGAGIEGAAHSNLVKYSKA